MIKHFLTFFTLNTILPAGLNIFFTFLYLSAAVPVVEFLPTNTMTSILRDRRVRVQKPENSGARCCVVGCSNRRGLDKVNGVQRSFHAFPTDQKRRQMWVKAIPRKLWTPGQWDRVCGDHFVGGEQLQFVLSFH